MVVERGILSLLIIKIIYCRNILSPINRLFPQMVMEFGYSFSVNVKGKAVFSNEFRNWLTNTTVPCTVCFMDFSHQKEYILQLWYFHVSLPAPHLVSPNPLFHPTISRAALAPECFLSILGSFTPWLSTLLSPLSHHQSPYPVCTCWLFNCGTKQFIGFTNSQNK